jgi:copper homeostasis protein
VNGAMRDAPVLVEACVDSVASSRIAERAGARRLELCAALHDGGTTPSAGTIAAVKAAVSIPVVVLVRPRGGSFTYDASELDVLRRDVAHARALGADGISTGVLRPDGTIDETAMATLVADAAPLPVTCHRAFDAAPDPHAALAACVRAGVARVLTAGGPGSARAGAAVLASLVRAAAGRIAIVAGGGVRADHAAQLVRDTGVRELHLWGARIVLPVQDSSRPLPLRTALPADAHAWAESDGGGLAAVVAAVQDLPSSVPA